MECFDAGGAGHGEIRCSAACRACDWRVRDCPKSERLPTLSGSQSHPLREYRAGSGQDDPTDIAGSAAPCKTLRLAIVNQDEIDRRLIEHADLQRFDRCPCRQSLVVVLPGWSCESVGVIFGAHVRSADTVEPAEWIASACRGVAGTVGWFVPNQYPLVLRVHAPDPGIEDWWSAYCDLFDVIASIGVRHTSSPDQAWFAVWEGHGYGTGTTQIAWKDPPPDDETRRAREQERARLREESERRNTAIGAALRQIPCFDLPHRKYYLLAGSVSAATQIEYPGWAGWHNPDLFWPDDRRWFVATDVDFWSLYIAGDHDFITELARNVPTHSELVALDLQVEAEV